ncbi:recombinase family protein [Asticcacaulis sp.]|uniref:recombinase family protein n=1 Tax=Asticcacaulis sp. TaxID=1872648 RepID=UPI00391AAAB3
MTRVALYARYSSDNQSASSIEDQFRICREQALREGWQVIGCYKDAAISGATVTLRAGIQAILQDALARKFDVILIEALDRLSRDQADVASLYKHLTFAGVKIVSLADGEINELHVGLKGTMNALFLKDLAAKTHRGMRGRVEKGKAGGGLCYGYRVVKRLGADGEPIRGERAINQDEAHVIRRIFKEFADGKSPRAIATDLNKDGITGPMGKAWGDTSIRGHVSRGNGIVNNALYNGVLVWNRQSYVKNPTSGKRVSRANPETAWIKTDVPDLKIVDDELWQRARARQAEIAKAFEPVTAGIRDARARMLNTLRRPAFLLSGLLKCGCCGGKYGVVVKDRYGCLNRYRRGNCDNGRTVTRGIIEQRALSGLSERLVSAESVADAVRAYTEELNRANHERRAQEGFDRKNLDKVERSIRSIITAIEDGLYQPSMKERMAELEAQKAGINARLSQTSVDMPDVNPNIAEYYRIKVQNLLVALNDQALYQEASEIIRSLVGEIVLYPDDKPRGVKAELKGELMGILNLANPSGGLPITIVGSPSRTQDLKQYQLFAKTALLRKGRFCVSPNLAQKSARIEEVAQ